MPVFEPEALQTLTVHRVGNKSTEEGFILSQNIVQLNERLRDTLVRYFINPFKGDEYFHFWHEDGLEHNIVFRSARAIFEDHANCTDAMREIAAHLYDVAVHPNIKAGDVFIAYFDHCNQGGNEVDAIGIFKAEVQDEYLKVDRGDAAWSTQEGDNHATAHFDLEIDKGYAIKHLDKGALIFNLEEEEGFVVSVYDASGRSADTTYWFDNFLGLEERHDDHYNTHNEMAAYKQFVTQELPQQFENVTKADQADLLNKSVEYFKKNDSFEIESFCQEVIAQPEVVESFAQYRQQYQEENEIDLQDSFVIDESAVKKQARAFKGVIKLDRNFHIYVHGDRDLIEQGEDERGKYYKVYYQNES